MQVFPRAKHFIFATLLIAYLAVGVFGLLGMATMGHHEMGGVVSNCPFMVGEMALCEMNIFDHIAGWQAMFTTLPPETSTLVLLALSLLLISGLLRYLYDPPDTSQRQSVFRYTRPVHSQSFTSLLLGSAISPRAP